MYTAKVQVEGDRDRHGTEHRAPGLEPITIHAAPQMATNPVESPLKGNAIADHRGVADLITRRHEPKFFISLLKKLMRINDPFDTPTSSYHCFTN